MALKPKYTVYHSAVLDADPDTVWSQVRDMMLLLKIVFGDGIENAHWVGGASAETVPARFDFTLLPNHDLAAEEVAGRSEHEFIRTELSVTGSTCYFGYRLPGWWRAHRVCAATRRRRS